MGKIGLGNQRHHVHHKGPHPFNPLGNLRNFRLVDTGDQHGVDLDHHPQIHGPLHPFVLAGQQDLGGIFTAVAPAVVEDVAIDLRCGFRVDRIDGDRQTMQTDGMQAIQGFRQQ